MLADDLDEKSEYRLTVIHSGTHNISSKGTSNYFIAVGGIKLYAIADSSNSVRELISNDGFVDNVVEDDGSKNIINGRPNFAEFFEIAAFTADGFTNEFIVDFDTDKIDRVYIEERNGQIVELYENIDWFTQTNDDAENPNSLKVVFKAPLKKDASVKIIAAQPGILLQRKILLEQPVTSDGEHDLYSELYVNNEGIYVEPSSNP